MDEMWECEFKIPVKGQKNPASVIMYNFPSDLQTENPKGIDHIKACSKRFGNGFGIKLSLVGSIRKRQEETESYRCRKRKWMRVDLS